MSSEHHFEKRRKARFLCVQALYQWSFTPSDSGALVQQFMQDNDMSKVDAAYFQQLVQDIISHVSTLDALLEHFADRTVDKMYPVELQILRQAAYELQYCLDIPYKVIIDEALNLTKTFAASHSKSYVNGILDGIAKQHRSDIGTAQ